jgi:hypothetical protein
MAPAFQERESMAFKATSSACTLALWLAALTPACAGTPEAPATQLTAAASLENQFQNPPMSARPRVWWHWMDGNISKDGIAKDIAWMKRSGIGGLQTFDASFGIPTVVEKRITYMSPEWKDAFRFSAQLAEQSGLELAIAASPGWSQTGGPWVKPEDALKKLVWSETLIQGGKRFKGVLAAPPSDSGPYQDLKSAPEIGSAPKKNEHGFYGDAAVFAYRVATPQGLTAPVYTLADGSGLEASPLADGQLTTGVKVPAGTSDAPGVINITYEHAQTIRSASLFIAGVADVWSEPAIIPRLEASDDGVNWLKVADFKLSPVPTTISFAAVTARQFRIVLTPAPKAAAAPDSAPGYTGYVSAPVVKKTLQILGLRLSPEARVNQFEAKAGFSVATDYPALDDGTATDTAGLLPADVIDLSGRMQPDGTLDWTPPRGTWRVVRMGYSLTGATNHPATPEATGLEVDKLDAAAVRQYLETYLSHYRDATGPDLIGAHGLKALLNDSTEVGAFNWTPRMLEQFQRLRGYDPRPWLPALTGAIVQSRAESDRFLFDFRRTIADLHASEHYGTVAEVAHENGLIWYSESLEGWRTSLGDDMAMRKYADVPMAAMWSFRREDGPKSIYQFDVRGAASTAHLYGQNIVAAESMTSTRYPWAHAPSDLRRVADAEFASGVNRIVIHTSPHQPIDKAPGLSMRHIGQFFTRNETWAEMARPWIDYLARSSLMLQQGRFVADVAYFYGEEEPTPSLGDNYADGPKRYGYDYVNADAVTNLLRVDNGDLIAPSGACYKLLYLSGSSSAMSLAMLRRIHALAEAGATIVGDAPKGSPGLGDKTPEYTDLVARLWSGQPVTPVGKGRVIAGKNIEQVLTTAGVKPDVDLVGAQADSQIRFVHRQLPDGDVYYLSNVRNRSESIEARFRVTGKEPEIWRADTAASMPVSYRTEGTQTIVSLSFEPEDSYFVVFRKPAVAMSKTVTEKVAVEVASLNGPWTVSFQPDHGAPASTTLAALTSLNENSDPGIKYFSGVATYSQSFSTPRGFKPGAPLWLDLGQVGDLAEVHLNGKAVGTLWHAPFRIDIGPAMTRGKNRLDIRIANLWVNRLIGDAQPGAKKVTFTITPTYKANAPLRPSGLIGPVKLLSKQ